MKPVITTGLQDMITGNPGRGPTKEEKQAEISIDVRDFLFDDVIYSFNLSTFS